MGFELVRPFGAWQASHVPYIILCPQDATDAGVLDGHLETSPLDLKESADFLEVIRQKLRLQGAEWRPQDSLVTH